MKKLSTEKQGEYFIFGEAFLWAWFPVITIITIRYLSPLYALALSTLISSLFFAIIITCTKQWKDALVKKAYRPMLK
ncbi:MAG: hypothetical protein COX81_01055 [Candidatus Magasanikbacteria bacterium CG_4_10_14_0_2_um_filter_37_12]|uniref:Uncharacterized protein n=1 Tax=Candidatus Magasanikbacteria bacterium CG_4_10_14_0_2_um_filter_37_12 TaxID=1974637 RepID=A0A2M7V935_9BACT|nr:MAG: hypothetical protein COX81_01055 [Candidatus Magasanikbacteria bacterium CG_4_10_14_0_2_um_filter_37_12]